MAIRNKQFEFDVFVSHSSHDKRWAGEFKDHLQDAGLRVWLDEFQILGGDSISNKIGDGLNKSRTIVFLITPASARSIWVQMEVSHAILNGNGNGRLIPVFLEKTDISHLPPHIKDIKTIDLSDPDPAKRNSNYRSLFEALRQNAPVNTPVHDVKNFPSPPPFHRDKSFEPVAGGYAVGIGAHWDDILLGCLGTLLKLKLLYGYRVETLVLCTQYGHGYFGKNQPALDDRARKIYGKIYECFGIGCEFTKDFLDRTVLSDRGFHQETQGLDQVLAHYANNHKDCNLVFAPPLDDQHEDHALTSKLTASHFRKSHQTVLEYEIKPHSDRGFVPNIFVGLSDQVDCSKLRGILNSTGQKAIADLKVELLAEIILKNPETLVQGADFLFDQETLRSRMRINALDFGGNKGVRYGEAFRGSVHL